ncbi:MAG: polyisoprenoid-binding protein YceI [Planctomycetota bacterium]|jgi:polyisoprenoid-binding protein YceI
MNLGKTILGVLVFGALLSSCSSNGKKAETKEAVAVEEASSAAITFSTIKEGSHLEWRSSHLAGAQPRFGKVSYKSAEVSVEAGKLTNAKVVIDLNTLTVENFPEGSEQTGKLTGHLKNEDFFNIAKFPTATFELTDVVNTTGDFNSKVQGNLTILDQTKSIIFSANVGVADAGISIESEDFAIDRRDWGLSYHIEGSEGVPVDYLITNDIGFTINVGISK